jgi:hypothetical protein
MSDDTLIEDLVRAGVSAELVGRVARLIVVRGRLRNSADTADRRRERDRERKRLAREKLRKNNEMAKANDVAIVRVSPRKSADAASEHCDLLRLSKKERLSERKESDFQESKTELVEGRKHRHGTRIPPDWSPSPEDYDFARQRGMDDRAIRALTEEFIDYWIAVPGQRGNKLDWHATFRNRVRQKTTNTPAASASKSDEPVWAKPPAEFLERQHGKRQKRSSIRDNAGMGQNGANHQEELLLSGRSVLQTEVSGTPGDAPNDQRKQS